MQLLPSTADDIARKSGGTAFVRGRPRQPAGQHLLRLVLPALPAAALRRQRGARDRGLQRRRGSRRPVDLRRPPTTARSSTTRATSRSRRRATTSSRCWRCAGATATSTGGSSGSEPSGGAGDRRRPARGHRLRDGEPPGGDRHGGLHAGVGGQTSDPPVGRRPPTCARASPATSRPTSPTPRRPAAVLAAARLALGHVDVLVANHAASVAGTIEEITAESIDLALAVNVRATLLLVQAFAAGFEGRERRPRDPADLGPGPRPDGGASCPTRRARRR